MFGIIWQKKQGLLTGGTDSSIAANVFGLCVRWGLESKTAEFRTMFKESTNDEDSTKATMTQNQC